MRSPPLFRELCEMIDRLAVILHRDLDVGFDEIPRLREIPVADAIALPDRAPLVHVDLVQEVHLLELVDVTIDRGLRRLELRRELLNRPSFVHPTDETLDEETIRYGVADARRIRLRIVPFRDVSDLAEKQKRDDVDVAAGRQ